MRPALRVRIDRTREVLKALNSLALSNVLVGVPEKTADKGANERAAETGGKVINNAALAQIHEYGAPRAGIPARPFLMPGIEKAKDECSKDLSEGAKAVLDTDSPGAARKALNKAGLRAAREVQKQFTENNWSPLKRKRSNKGRSYREGEEGNDKPLIDTGALRASITYEIREGS